MVMFFKPCLGKGGGGGGGGGGGQTSFTFRISRVLMLADDGLIYRAASGHRCPGATGKGVTLMPRD